MITDIFDKVAADALMVTDPTNGLPIVNLFGSENIALNSAPPRIVWVPTNDNFAKGKVTSSYGSPGYDRTQRSTGTRYAGLMIEVWGAGAGGLTDTGKAHHKATEVLMHRLLTVIHRQFFGSFKVDGANWVAQDGSSLGQFGRKVLLACSVEIPLAEPALDLTRGVVITAEEQTPVVVAGTLGGAP